MRELMEVERRRQDRLRADLLERRRSDRRTLLLAAVVSVIFLLGIAMLAVLFA